MQLMKLMKRINTIVFLTILLISCGIPDSPGLKNLEALAKELNAENVTAGYGFKTSTDSENLKSYDIEIFNSTIVDVKNRSDCDAHALVVVNSLWDKLYNLDSTTSVINIIFTNDKSIISTSTEIVLTLDDLISYKAQEKAELGDYENAFKLYDRAISIAPNKAASYYNNKAVIYMGLKNYDEAIREFKLALNLEPNSKQFLKNLGAAYSWQEEYEKAIEMFSQALKIDQKYEEALGETAQCYAHMKEFEKAIEIFNKALSISPNNLKWERGKAVCFMEINNLDSANTIIDKVLLADDQYGNAYFTRGKIRLKENKNKEACEDFRHAITLGVQGEVEELLGENCK